MTKPTPELTGYELDLHHEQEHYKDVAHVHDLPGIFHYWSNKYVLPFVIEAGGTAENHVFAMYAKYMALGANNCGQRTPVFLSVGAGNCDSEILIARLLKAAGLKRFVIECLELNPAMLDRGRALAKEAGLARHLEFAQADFNKWTTTRQYAAVIANHSLHHVLDLEHLLDQIKQSLHPNGYFVTNDMIGRNGHMRWPEALRDLQRFWRELPVEQRWNRSLSRYEEEYINHDCSVAGFEGIRAQDILPLLLARFDFRVFIGFSNLVDVFLDRPFGHNFNRESARDREFIDRVHEFDEQSLVAGKLTPTHIIAVMTPGPCAEHYFSRGLSPASSVRNPAVDPALDPAELSITTSSLQRWPKPDGVPPQTLTAAGGVPPYHWSATGLPPGLEVSPSGLLNGRPKRDGIFDVNITVTDSSVPVRTASQRYTIGIRNILAITSPRALPPGIAGREHGQKLYVTGGKAPHTWSVIDGALPVGLALDPETGVIAGVPSCSGNWSFRVQVTDSEGVVDASDAVLEIAEPDNVTHSAVLAHVAAGDSWNTSIHLLNPSPSAVDVTVEFRRDDGSPLALPLNVSTDGSSRVNKTIAPYSSLTAETALSGTVHLSGCCEVTSSSRIAGYAVFHYQSPDGVQSCETVPLDTGGERSLCFLFDNADGTRTGIAIANLEAAAALMEVTAWDGNWNQLAQQELVLPARGHASFLASDQLPGTADHRGVLQFRATGDVRIAGLSLLFPSNGRLITTPKLPLSRP